MKCAVPLPFLTAYLALAAWLCADASRASAQAPSTPDDAELLQAWEDLARSKSKKKKVVRLFVARIEELDSFQLELVRGLEEQAGKPAKPGKPPFFDPKEHVRNQPVRRKALKEDDESYAKLKRLLSRDEDARSLRSAHRYDWNVRRVVRFGNPDDPDLVFHNALQGYPPGLDLARAQALAMLDGGHQVELMRAFSNCYTDRNGGLYPDITLYDTWSSGLDMEMPDVDTLGLVHTLLGDWETWTDPVAGEDHDALYGAIGELFRGAQRYREPRESAVDNLLIAHPVPRKGYQSLHGNFQALWARHGSDVEALAREFPDAEDWRSYAEAWVRTCKSDQQVWDRGLERRARLAEGADAVRAALVAAMREAGVLD